MENLFHQVTYCVYHQQSKTRHRHGSLVFPILLRLLVVQGTTSFSVTLPVRWTGVDLRNKKLTELDLLRGLCLKQKGLSAHAF
jgi:hypothetical protein